MLGVPNLDIIGGKDCEGVTKTPGHCETFKLGSISIKSIHTPCHTQDSICFFMEDGDQKAVFTGDTMFTGGVCIFLGKSCRVSTSHSLNPRIGCGKFFEGSAAEMHEALNRRLFDLEDDTIVYVGDCLSFHPTTRRPNKQKISYPNSPVTSTQKPMQNSPSQCFRANLFVTWWNLRRRTR